MEITTPALMSIIALLVLIAISCFREEIHVGFLGLGFGVLVGGIWGDTNGARVLNYWPVGICTLLIGVSFLFGLAVVNGTLQKLTDHSLRLCKGNTALVPLIIYILTTVLGYIGPGNIAITALVAPMAMIIGARVGMSAFLMTLVVVGAANGTCVSPFTPTGAIADGIITKLGPELGIAQEQLLPTFWRISVNTTIAHTVSHFIGFMVLGGWTWIKQQRGQTVNIDEFAPKPEPFTKHQVLTVACMVALLVLLVVPSMPAFRPMFPKPILNILANVGTISFMLGSILMMTGSGDGKAVLKVMPWNVIMMICGVTVLIEVMDKAGGLNFLVKALSSLANPVSITGVVGLITGVLSAYSSSSGVILPTFLPMVPGLIKEVGGGDPVALFSSVVVGSHLVDTSPLSGLGAMCLACAGDHEDKSRLFRILLMWGMSMSIVGAILCYVMFGVLGL